MSKIAIIDLFFYWPPGGGSHVDVKEIAQRLSLLHEVKVFVPNIVSGRPFKYFNPDLILKRTKFFNRGIVRGKLNLDIVPLDFDLFSFNHRNAPSKFLKEIAKFNPDSIFFAQGSFMKPTIIKALKDYRIISRYYSNEAFCLKGDGQYFRNGRICSVNYLDSCFKSFITCAICSSSFLIGYPSPLFLQEYIASLSFKRTHQNDLIESLKIPEAVIVYNDFVREKLSGFNENVITVPGGVDIKSFAKNIENGHNGIKNILMLGRSDDKAKGFELLFNTAARMWTYRKDFNLMVTVRDKMPSKYKSEFITNLGWLPHEKISRVYAKSDLVVVPSIWAEPFGIVAVEAMASAKPVVASKVGGLSGIIEHEKTGFVFDPSDLGSLENYLNLLLDNPSLRNKMGEAGFAKARLYYDWNIVFEKYYRKLF
jgi:glycosyltransferase involved in cell wall biosynthesis